MNMENVRLTQYSHGAGCGCKISPSVLSEILATKMGNKNVHPDLLVGYEHRDDAAVLDLKNGTALISTTDFFMPIVDDPYDFGRIASVNAISDVYAMGGKPILALGILAWPINQLSTDIASRVLEGARTVCQDAGIPLAGGHSIDSPEPIFGLSVNGIVSTEKLRQNSAAKKGDLLYLTKPIGVGIITTAQKKSIVSDEDYDKVLKSMLALNLAGDLVTDLEYVHTMTDVTGFGLAGHLIELCEASGLSAELELDKIPLLSSNLAAYIEKGSVPGGTQRNWKSYGHKVELHQSNHYIIADPQTSGGLLMAVAPNDQQSFERFMDSHKQTYWKVGQMIEKQSEVIYCKK